MGIISRLVIIVNKGRKIGRTVKNRLNFTVCTDSYEKSVMMFRVCNNNSKWADCYKRLDKEVERVRIKDKEYPLCPYAPQACNQEDLKEYQVKVFNT